MGGCRDLFLFSFAYRNLKVASLCLLVMLKMLILCGSICFPVAILIVLENEREF